MPQRKVLSFYANMCGGSAGLLTIRTERAAHESTTLIKLSEIRRVRELAQLYSRRTSSAYHVTGHYFLYHDRGLFPRSTRSPSVAQK